MALRCCSPLFSLTTAVARGSNIPCITPVLPLIRRASIRWHGTGKVGKDGPTLKDFLKSPDAKGEAPPAAALPSYIHQETFFGEGRKVYFETYGCQMNTSDTEVAWSVLQQAGYVRTAELDDADVVLVVTCAIRDNAERKVWQRLDLFRLLKRRRAKLTDRPPLQIGVLGCMAEHLKTKLVDADKRVDLVAGPDSYRDLPRMLASAHDHNTQVNVLLSLEETYANISPVRLDPHARTAYVTIQRGCDNMCAFCIVPFTRGRERSRPRTSILAEIRALAAQGVREITLLGQNVNSYRDTTEVTVAATEQGLSRGFRTIYKTKQGGLRFADLLAEAAESAPHVRFRFTSPHPKDFPDEVLSVMQAHPNLCRSIHLPVQSGSSTVLARMRRGYTRESFIELVDRIRSFLPDVTFSSDIIAGFCGETREEHEESLSLLRRVQFDSSFVFAYSMRDKTHAYHRLEDNVPQEEKVRRVDELVTLLHAEAARKNTALWVGKHMSVLVDRPSRRSPADLLGRSDGNQRVVFPKTAIPCKITGELVVPLPGDIVEVVTESATSFSFRGKPLARTSIAPPLGLSESE
eukprot:m.137557 g.137557  ORF g.137557 m.137557 type:complete len:577 (-) comp14901_c0_seq5:132-1862(-)